MQQHMKRSRMNTEFSDELFRRGVPESKKFELIYRTAATLSPKDLQDAVARLRADWRYARILGALIDASKNEKLAIEELFVGNALTPKIVAGFKWLYMNENKGFISEDFVKNTLPAVSSSCQKRVVNKISKWVTNTELGDKIWAIVRSRSLELSYMLLGACSNELIMREIMKNNACLSLAQMLDILRKRFDSGLELIRAMAEADKLRGSPINVPELHRFILKRDFKKGTECLSLIKKKVSHGRHLTRKLIKLVSSKELDLSTLLTLIKHVNQHVLARHASQEVYMACFLENFDWGDYLHDDLAMLEWLNHLRDDAKLKAIDAWYQKRRGSALVDNFATVPESFLFLLDEKTLERVVTQRIEIGRHSDDFTDKDLMFWQSMLPDDEESLAKQKQRLKGESNASVRKIIYLNMLKSVTVLKRPQYLERRLRFVVERIRNDYESQAAIIELLYRTLRDEYKFKFDEEIWPHLRDFIQLRLLLEKSNGFHVERVYQDILLLGLEKVDFDQPGFLASIMEMLIKVLGLNRNLYDAADVLSTKKRQYFWNGYLTYAENHKDTKKAPFSATFFPEELRDFYLALAERAEETRNLIEAYPKTFSVLNRIVNTDYACEGFRQDFFQDSDLFRIYQMLRPLLPPDAPLCRGIVRAGELEEERTRKEEALKAFAKSNIMTEEVRLHYLENRDKNFARLCWRSLLHADAEQYSTWIDKAEGEIDETPSLPYIYRTFNLLAAISSPDKFRTNVESFYPTTAKIESLYENGLTKRMGIAKCLRFFGDSFIASEMLMHFMKGDYLCYALSGFKHHMSRLPTAKVVAHLQQHVLNRNSGVSARKTILQGLFANTLMCHKDVVLGLVQQLSVKEEHDNIKNETLLAIFKIVENVGEEDGWPLLKTCLNSIGVEDRTCFTTTLISKVSIDEHIPSNIEYLMGKLLEISESEEYVKEYRDVALRRIGNNLKRLTPDFLFAVLDRIKSCCWSSYAPRSLAIEILMHCLPKQAEALNNHFMSFGHSKILDLTNSRALTRDITKRCVASNIGNALEVLDFLDGVFEKRSSDDFLEQRLLDLTKIILPLIPERREGEHLRPSLREVALAALRTTAGFIDKFGSDLCEFLVDDCERMLRAVFPDLAGHSDWTKYFLDVYHEGLSRRETIIFLRVLKSCTFDEDGTEKSRKLFVQHEDRMVRIAFRKFLV